MRSVGDALRIAFRDCVLKLGELRRRCVKQRLRDLEDQFVVASQLRQGEILIPGRAAYGTRV